ncbi:MAG: discoidin domain-containing protein, partial [Planctomycetota bacterium]
MWTMMKIAAAWCLVLLVAGLAHGFQADKANEIIFPNQRARFVRFVIQQSSASQPCIDELEVYGPDGKLNLALAQYGAKATASSCLPGYAIHRTAHLNDGLYGNDHSWIAAGTRNEWAQIEFPAEVTIARVVFSRDRNGRYHDRIPVSIEIRVSADGTNWRTVARSSAFPTLPEGPVSETELLRYAFECEDLTWRKFDPSDSVDRVLRQMEKMIERFASVGLDVSKERGDVREFRLRRRRLQQAAASTEMKQELFFRVRQAKRRLFFRAPELAVVEQILFVKRHPFEPSHNYSV